MNKKRGFTLIELLISLSLMIIIIGALVIIFDGVTGMMTTTENRMFIFQNARAGLNNLEKDLKNTQDNNDHIFTINNPQNDTSPHLLMKFLSTTSFMNSSSDDVEPEIVTSEARIFYYLEEKNNRWTLKRHIVDAIAKDVNGLPVPDPDPVNESYEHTLANDIVCQFIAEENSNNIVKPSFQIDYFAFDTSNGQIQVIRPNTIVFNNDIDDPLTKFPFAIRLNADLTDERGRLTRTFSKVVQLLITQD
ncbi:prepilin-type N-terminal cleavage/methylation domain-containing protein [Candidatus Uabimicrobium sp. HlEnr_7]|uniref:prepilin-type N-terminal cleavage/methylation domain-containing protein n=1 Tax=Candidatus Uabimicrobium helgolandensis TaxID=3095367 RepID=UPI003558422F